MTRKSQKKSRPQETEELTKVRIDKWLWAARFFKTRGLAQEAINGGKILLEKQRVKPSRDISVSANLEIKQGFDLKVIVVKALSETRKGASEAQALYEETAESLHSREEASALRKAASLATPKQEGRPNKKDRRNIHRFKENNS